MTIAILANDSRKDLMADFCNAYSGILSKHNIVATASTGNVVEKATGLKIRKLLAGNLGGTQQVAQMIAYGEVDMVLFFNNYADQGHDAAHRLRSSEMNNILRLCDMYTVPLATNIAAAELLVRGLGRGDLDWREIELHEDKEDRVS
jgi:methylglyoxal synthase